MGRTARKYQEAFTKRDTRKVERALSKTSLAREHDRLQALRLLAAGYSVEETAAVLGLSRPTLYRTADRYVTKRRAGRGMRRPPDRRPRGFPAARAEQLVVGFPRHPPAATDRSKNLLSKEPGA